MLVVWLAAVAMAVWLAILLLPSRPWSTRERLVPIPGPGANLHAVTVLIPARNEADTIAATLAGLAAQGPGLAAVVIDDESSDGTAGAAHAAHAAIAAPLALTLVSGRPLPDGWGGKLWALEQGLERVATPYTLLLDAEIVLAPGVLAALLRKAGDGERALVSVMATLRCVSFWERLLVPPFVFFFKLLYPFARVNSKDAGTAAAAGGCVLIETRVLREIGGFAAFRDALIDDCTLAARVKGAGHGLWLGLSEAVTSARAYPDLASFRRMVARTAFTQLNYSAFLLALVVVLMLVVFVSPWIVIAAGPTAPARLAGALAVLAMAAAYWPTVAFYRLPLPWTLSLPIAGVLFAMMTLESAVRYWRGSKAEWKGRTYVALAACLWALAPAAPHAQETDRWRFRQIQVENDVFPVPYSQPGDRFYTNGLRLSLGKGLFEPGADTASLPFWLEPVRNWCRSCQLFPSFSLGQQIYTPEDIEESMPQPGERPWAAWLYGGFGAAVDTSPVTRHDFEVQLGVTGDAAGGEFVQRLWHEVVGSPKPRGWDNQFGLDPGINAYYNFQHILVEAPGSHMVDWDFVPSVKAAVGTMMTYAGVGGTFRVGRNITDFPYSPIRPSERSVSVDRLPNLEIYGFIGADLRAVAYNYFLEGSLFDDEIYTVDPERYVWDFNFGVTARFRHFNITYAVVRRSAEFVRTAGTDRGIHSFGSLSLTVGIR